LDECGVVLIGETMRRGVVHHISSDHCTRIFTISRPDHRLQESQRRITNVLVTKAHKALGLTCHRVLRIYHTDVGRAATVLLWRRSR
jgi:hypothetical protein